jgi:NSS family neurotransmitter:Na+ symporter
MNTAAIETDFESMLTNWPSMIIYTFLVIILAVIICSAGLQKGVEKVTKYMMLSLLFIMVALAVRNLFFKSGYEGLKFYLMPSIENLKKVGVGNVIVAAMNQAFFTLSLGIGSMAIFGSYLKKDRSLMGESVLVAALDTFVAVASGLIIFPACAAYGVAVDSGPDLIFVTLPNVFNNMPLGRVFGSLFFVFMSFAALTTVITVFENIVACCNDLFGWSKKKASVINGLLFTVLTLPCIFGFNLLSGVTPFGKGSNIMDLEDFAVSNILLPLGALVFVVFTTSKKGWGWENFLKEANTGRGLKVPNWLKGYMTYVLPIIILALFVIGIYNFFK